MANPYASFTPSSTAFGPSSTSAGFFPLGNDFSTGSSGSGGGFGNFLNSNFMSNVGGPLLSAG